MKCKKVFEAFHKDLVKGVLSGESPGGQEQHLQQGGRSSRGPGQEQQGGRSSRGAGRSSRGAGAAGGQEQQGGLTSLTRGQEQQGGWDTTEGLNHFEMLQVTLCIISSPRQTSPKTSYDTCGK